ncbi:glycosyltransferase family 2 protein [Francisella philomiragia]|uniref:Glycosyl transferase 2 family protein n=1 Tax=Francisella philomiragia TaxID=28110 RepID=A0AAW3DB75_9GAMM|nr:glycosyltransferase family A protein [Francisella philomiragia]KFJ42703.1 glycosyl transferase 2 family protein [Francisella philomiragia]MBK2254147.1 glycosyltransferase family 2 protein [Francisella philomiragia]MBK2272459.1 glycosyltransferase family 2 protein [Francisella philomiragia]MBK2276301.1 glycosyltransferase family 2 protein [Francisella philomiragia]MBK2280248.1 glycosyltransferase family 2 protein [Francisella philomiragia]
MNIKFTVVIPLYNKEKYVVRCLESIKAQIYVDFDVLIIDDGSTDRSEKNVKEWLQDNSIVQKVVFMSQNNMGVLHTRNLLLKNAQNRFVAFLDADDVWLPNHLEELSKLIKQYQDKVTIYSTAYYRQRNDIKVSHDIGKYSGYFGILDYFDAMSQSSGYINSSVVCIDKQQISSAELFGNLDVKTNEDLLIWAKLARDQGLAFSAVKTGINYIDAGEASLNGSLHDTFAVYLEILKISQSWDNKSNVKKYLRIFALKNIANLRLNSTMLFYLKSIIGSFNIKVLQPWLYTICILCIPKFFLRKKMII